MNESIGGKFCDRVRGGVLWAAVLLAALMLGRPALGADLFVSTVAELANASSQARPGDTLIMRDGVWQDADIIFAANGTAASPVTLRARTLGQVFLSGQSRLRISGNYLVVDGLTFTNGFVTSGEVIAFQNTTFTVANHCRLTNCVIVDYNPPDLRIDTKWVSLFGFSNRVENCFFKGKGNVGSTMVVWVSAQPDQPNYHYIAHNYFGFRPPLGTNGSNGGETIRVGTSDVSMNLSHTTVEGNYFERCNGDVEIISSKSVDNIYRHNTFVECEGSLSLRHGNRCLVEGNYFFGNNKTNTGGVRLSGEDHRVYNNYFAELRGTASRAPLTLMQGLENSPLNGYFQVKRATVAFNTWVNCTNNNLLIGLVGTLSGTTNVTTLPPVDCTIANNVVAASRGKLIDQRITPENLLWEGNIMFGPTLGIPATAGIDQVDPRLVLGADGLWRPNSASPVRGAAQGVYGFVTTDMDGQPRPVAKDIGADQSSAAPVLYPPLMAGEVGPLWMRTRGTVLSWFNPSDITYGTALSVTQLNATANAPGNFIYSPPAGTILDVGSGQRLSVVFTPGDTVNFATVTQTVTLNVLQATPAITWPNPTHIFFGTALGVGQLNATSSVPGTFVYAPSAGTMLPTGNGQILSAIFTPSNAVNYTAATQSVTIDVLQAIPVIAWANPVDVASGTVLGAAQLNATANVPGTWAYTPMAGTVLEAGSGQILSVLFTPEDMVNYATVSKTVTLNVRSGGRLVPIITWPTPANLAYGTPLGPLQLNATANVPGSFTYTPSAGTLLNVGNGQILSVVFRPQDTNNYTAATNRVAINVANPALVAEVRVAYLVPTNRVAQSGGAASLQHALTLYQGWFRDQMSQNGFGPKTFTFQTEADGVTPKIHVVPLTQTDRELRSDIWGGQVLEAAAAAGVPVGAPGQVWWLVPEAHAQNPEGSIYGGFDFGYSYGSSGVDGGWAMMGSDALALCHPDYLTNSAAYDNLILPGLGPFPLLEGVSFPWFEGVTVSSVSSSAMGAGLREIVEAFGMDHDFRNDENFNGNLMGYGFRGFRGVCHPEMYPYNYTRLSYGAALALNVSPYFNPGRPVVDDVRPLVTIATVGASVPVNGLLRITFSASDAHGLYAALLSWNNHSDKLLVDEMVLSGTNVTRTFAIPYFDPGQPNEYTLRVFDLQGNERRATTVVVPAATLNHSPRPFITVSPATVGPGEDVILDASATFDPEHSASLLEVEWDIDGDGQFDTEPMASLVFTNRYLTLGPRLIRARVTDPAGDEAISAPVAVGITPCVVTFSPATRTNGFGAGGSTVNVKTSAKCIWSVVSLTDWITITSATNFVGSNQVSYAVEANTNFAPRSGVIAIADNLYTIVQKPFACTYSLSPTMRYHGFGGGSGTVKVTTKPECAWTVANTNNWITITSVTNGAGTFTVSYSVPENRVAGSRMGTLFIGDEPFTVGQWGTNCAFVVAPATRLHGEGSETGLVTVTTSSGCFWTVDNPNDWITITSAAGGTGNSNVAYTVAANPGLAVRTGVLTIGGETVTVSQMACQYQLSPASRIHNYGSESGQLTVTTSGGCAWAVNNPNSWITITFGANGTGNGTVGYTVAANPVGGVRTGVLTIAGQRFTVTQAGIPCSYAIDPIEWGHGEGVEVWAVDVMTTDGCPWTVENTVDWITILSGHGGTGPGQVVYLVHANPGPPRYATIGIAGQEFTIEQAGGVRLVQAGDIAVASGQTNCLVVELESHGIENSVNLSLCFNTNLVTFVSAQPGDGALGSTLSVDASQAALGRVGLRVALPPGWSIPAGIQPMASVCFRGGVVVGTVTAPVTLCDQPVARVVSDVLGQAPPVTYLNGSVRVIGACSLGLSLDAPQLVWATAGAAPWVCQTNVTHDGEGAAVSGTVGDGLDSYMETTVNGPGVLSFWWKVSSEPSNDRLRLYVDGSEVLRISGEVDWEQQLYPVPSGSHVLRWRYSKDSGLSAGQDRGWVDQVRFVPSPPEITAQPASRTADMGTTVSFSVAASGTPPLSYQWRFNGANLANAGSVRGANTATLTLSNVQPIHAGSYSVTVANAVGSATSDAAVLAVTPVLVLAEALDTTNLTWTVGGAVPWVGQGGGVTHDGVDAGRSGPAGDGEESWMETAVIGPGTLTYWWKVSSTPLDDRLRLYVDGTEQFRISGEVDWEFRTYAVASGSHVLRFRYSKSSSAPSGLDRGWVDEVRFGAVPPSITTQPVNKSVDAGTTVNLTVVAAGVPPLTYQWKFNGTNLANGGSVSGATTVSLTLAGVQPAQSGAYSVVVNNPAGSVTSSNAVVTISPVVSLAEALDTTNLTWTVGGDVLWVGQGGGVTHDGVDAGRSGPAGDDQESWMETTVTGPGTLSYWWKVSSTPLDDRLRLYVDGTEQFRITGEVDWEFRTYAVASGSHVLRFRYTRKTSPPSGQDRGWVDEVQFIADGASVAPSIAVHPVSRSVVAPGTVSFGVGVIGATPLGYQWQFNGTDLADGGGISGATTTNLALSGVQGAQAGNYSVVVSNAAGTATSFNALLTVITSPVITNQPASQNVVAGATVTFSVGALGTATLGYQWRVNGTNLLNSGNVSGAATAALRIASVTATQAGAYSVVVSNSAGSVTSAVASLMVSTRPIISSHPASRTVVAGTNLTLTVGAAGTAPLRYQWRFNGISLTDTGSVSGATTASLTLSSVVAAHAGAYSVTVSNAVGGVISSNALVTVILPPAVTLQPLGQTVAEGVTASFTVAAAGTAPLSYQWRLNGTNLVNSANVSGVTTTTLTVANVQPIQAGNYSVGVSNAGGGAVSSNALLRVLAALTLAEAVDAPYLAWNTGVAAPWLVETNVTHDGRGAARSGNISSNQTTWLEATVMGPGNLRFWWKVSSQTNQDVLQFYVDGTVRASLSGEAGWEPLSFDLPPGNMVLRWAYAKDGSVNSGQDRAWLDQVVFAPGFGPAPPVIMSQPAGREVDPGATVTFRVEASGTGPMSYQWRFNGVDLIDGANLSGSTLPALTVANVQAANEGTYYVVVRNSYSLDISSNAFLAVIPNIPVTEAVDTSHTNLIWIPGGYSAWKGQEIVTHDRVDAVQSGPVVHSQTNWIETTVLGPSSISFWWKVSSETNRDYLRFLVNGVEQANLSGEADWRRRSFDLQEAAAYRLRWAYTKDAAGTAGQDRGWVDQIVYGPMAPVITNQPDNLTIVDAGTTVKLRIDAAGTPPFSYQWQLNGTNLIDGGNVDGATGSRHITLTNALAWQQGTYNIVVSNAAGIAISEDAVVIIHSGLSLAESLNTKTNWYWGTGGYSYWLGQTNVAHDGVMAARSGTLPNGRSTWMETTNIVGPGTLTFWWKVSSETNHDFLTWYIDGVPVSRISGEAGWTAVTNDFLAGFYTVRWEYSKDSLGTNGMDRAFVDEVDFGSIPPMITNQPVSVIVDAGATASFTVASRGTPPLFYQWRFNGNNLSDGGNINGAKTPRLQIANVQPAQAGIYTVVVDNTNSSRVAVSSNAVLTVTPLVPLAEALDTTNLVWTTSGTPAWVGQPVVTQDGVDAARIAGVADGLTASMQTTLIGPGTVSFWWKVSSETNKDALIFFIGTTEQARLSGEAGWQQRSFNVPAGTQVLKWTYSKNATLSNGLDRAWVDGVIFAPVAAVITSHPASTNVDAGSAVSFSVVATGTPPLTYQWIFNGVALANGVGVSGVTNATLTLTGVQPARAGSYSVIVRNGAGAVESVGALLTVTPLVALAEALDMPTLTWTTTGTPPWVGQGTVTHDGVDAARSGAIGDSASTSMQTTVNGPGTVSFWWKVSAQPGSDQLQFFVNGTQQTNVSGEVDWQRRSFDLPAGSQVLRWTYLKNGSTATGLDRGWVDQVTFGPVPPLITAQPVSRSVDAGAAVSFTVAVSGTPTLSYQWRFNGANLVNGGAISGAATATLVLAGVQLAQAGNYSVVVNNAVGSVTSSNAVLTVTPLFALAQALDTTNLTWTVGGDVPWVGQGGVTHDGVDAGRSGPAGDGQESWMETTVTGPGTLSYWWKVSSTPLDDRLRLYVDAVEQFRVTGEVDWEFRTYAVAGGSHVLRFRYSKSSTAPTGQDRGWVDQVQFALTPPSITTQPLSRAVDAGATVNLTVVAAGAPPLTYQWRLDGVPLANGGNVSGATTASLTLADAPPAQSGLYSVVVNNPVGSVTSSNALVTITPVVSLAEALDTTNLTWTAGGDAPWVGQAGGVTHDGVDAARSGAIGDDQESWMETTVTGPGTLSYWWKVSSTPLDDRLRLYVDAVEQFRVTGEVDWEFRTYAVAGGSHVLRFRYTRKTSPPSGQDRGWVDQVRFGPAPTVIIAQPAGGTVDAGTTVTFGVTATGAAPLTYQWRFNGADLANAGNVSGVTTATLTLANAQPAQSGAYSVVVSGPGGSLVSANALLTVVPLLPLDEALDTPALVWTTSGTPPWVGQPVVTFDTVDAARSGAIGHSQTTSMQTTVNGPGTVLFWWRVSSEPANDPLLFYIGATEQARLSGEVNWQQRTFSVPAGSQVLRWTYAKNSGVSTGQDRGWVDQVGYAQSAVLGPFLPVPDPAPTSTNSAPIVVRVALAGNKVTLTWDANPNKTCQVFYKDGLADPEWKLVDGDVLVRWKLSETGAVSNDSLIAILEDVLAGPSRFYRILEF